MAGLSDRRREPGIPRSVDRSRTDSSLPSTDEIFEPSEVPGLDTQPAFGVIEPFVEFATLDRAIEDRAGGRYRVTFSRYADRDLDQFSFDRWDVDLRQFIPFVHGTHTLAFRAWASASDAVDGDSVPFYLQPTLGGSRSLRGYRTFRFRDRSALLFQGGYRWRINEFVTGALFYDTGAVAPSSMTSGGSSATMASACAPAAAPPCGPDRRGIRRARRDSLSGRFDDAF